MRSGKGTRLVLEDGRELLDMISSWWVNLHGHAHPDIAEAIYKQALELEQVIFAGFTHEPAEEFAKELLELLNACHRRETVSSHEQGAPHTLDKLRTIAEEATASADYLTRRAYTNSTKSPGVDKNLEPFGHVFYSDNGSTAVEVALKMAFQFWRNCGREGKTGFVCFEGGYHGDTVGAMSVGEGSAFWGQFKPLMFTVKTMPVPTTFDQDQNVEQSEHNAIAQLKTVLEENCDKLAAIVIEPLVQGAGGMRMHRPQFLSAVRSLADQFNVLLVFDEVMTGFGRTGDWFAVGKSEVAPDIVCLSKGITGGFLPLSVTVCSAKIYEAFLSEDWTKMLVHGHSYTANPLSLAAARASLKLLKANSQSFATMEQKHRELYQQHLRRMPNLKRARFCGTIFAVDVEAEADGYFNAIGPHMREEFMRQGLLIRPLGNTVYLMPPYCTSEDELELAYRAIARTVGTLAGALV